MKIAVYPGSFDPITNGHLDIIKRASKVFDKVIVSILVNSSKTPCFEMEERRALIERVMGDLPNVEVDCFEGLLVNYVRKKGAHVIIKGLRAISDFEYEFQMALANTKIAPDIETLFMMTNQEYSYLSSSIVKELASLGGSLEGLVPDEIMQDIIDKVREHEERLKKR
ncbi:pantetheine-phosphate adenylyltransferase [Acetivibrio sp. MSJd-27]|jgi:pantetheine-phosphate adenylyltransferase|uniref:pantetheine-phosphate adenylyltransferase n=1 Tax=Acetivibrio sp. MSJd-27 TaxID=2841523 RepID=UPI0015ADC43A|nr:pantetheine-phosphate adenylyltransferase [Acetivibrio sp. MSJd-27]MBU5449418.1 pantetheine-phosphate adenylyltransferase [Acetivibrio sp. MSJd-27]